ncbi:hypothetical protein FRB96_006469 [Tulasnella sp. 330]|nr:hypothetical protein FRB96_006469 [Tulasnella sp. 330]KAG8879127.1 hypothetical protein FRB97_001952 [Tulasnella sp. 331]
MSAQKKILFVFTSANTNLLGNPTGWYLPEAAHPYYVLAPTHNITFASPAGANPPLDPFSVEQFKEDEESQKFLGDADVKKMLAEAKKLTDIDPDDYDAIFYPGGPTAAVCHGPGAFAKATDSNNVSIFKGRRATGFSNLEEELFKMVKAIPFLLEDNIKFNEGAYEKAAEPWAEHVVVDGNLITGQNPASARAIGQALLRALR